MPFTCFEAWKTENPLSERRDLGVCRGGGHYGFLTAPMPQTHLPVLQRLAADRHSYTSSAASSATRPAFPDTQKLGGKHARLLARSVGALPSRSLGPCLHCTHSESPERPFCKPRAGITADPDISCSIRGERAAKVTGNDLGPGSWKVADRCHALSLEHVTQERLPYRASQTLINYIPSKPNTLS